MRRVGLAAFWGSAAMVIGLAACSELLGFNRVEHDGCVLPSDCAGQLLCLDGICSVQCKREKDCSGGESCSASGRCVRIADAGVITDNFPDEALEVGPDASPARDASEEPSIPDSSDSGLGDEGASDADDEVSCTPACQTLNECRRGACHQAEMVGPFGAASTYFTAPTSADAWCFQIPLSVCADLTGVGFILRTAINATVRFAIYDDVNGHPTNWLTQTSEEVVNGTTKNLAVNPVVAVGCEGRAVWLCFASSAPDLQFSAIPQSTEVYVDTRVSPTQLAEWLSVGLPDAGSQSITSVSPVQPLLYTWLVPRP